MALLDPNLICIYFKDQKPPNLEELKKKIKNMKILILRQMIIHYSQRKKMEVMWIQNMEKENMKNY